MRTQALDTGYLNSNEAQVVDQADDQIYIRPADPDPEHRVVALDALERARSIAERIDDYCATAYVYCRDAQPVPRLDVAAVTADISRFPHEQPTQTEQMLGG